MNTRTAYYNEASLGDLIGDIARGWRWVVGGALVGALLAALFLTMAVPRYRAAMLVGPVSPLVDPAPAEGDALDFARFEAVLRGPAVAARLYENEAIRAGMADDIRWRGQRGPVSAEAAHVADYLPRVVQVMPVGAAGDLRRVSYDHPDPVFAAHLLSALADAADAVIVDERRAQAAARTDYLAQTLAATQNPEHRRTLTAQLMAAEQAQALLAMDRPFAAARLEPAATGLRPQWPRPALIVPAFVLAGMVLGFALFSLRRR